MNYIKLGCKTQGFNFGAVVEVGKGKGKISKEDADILISEGNATEYKQPVVSSNRDNTKIAEELELSKAEVAKLTEELELSKAEARAEVERLSLLVDAAIALPKGTAPEGWEVKVGN